jgi:hypothetical protein
LLVDAQHFRNFISYIHDSLDIKGLILLQSNIFFSEIPNLSTDFFKLKSIRMGK